ncbi:Uncharacterized membrane protein [Microbacterium sp. cf046]|uniref:DUF2306 domain-containing protein n=1 Tax=Microbacterium sp. cf046 TaxID=1761803 RepID=UPI0008EFADBB|nr:DUF2306 domain-containing protein [Microbacterium sp. cf046]SFR93202.1 Uncharacterized membrane protein [Microbacterium sp. cf046]
MDRTNSRTAPASPTGAPLPGGRAMSVVAARVAAKGAWTQWLAPSGLIVLSLIPILAGGLRLAELTGNPIPTPANARFVASPIPVVVHIVSVTIFSLLGAFQFAPALRRRGARWHRTVGRILIPAGLLTAFSGMWMAVFYAHPAGDGVVLLVLRLVFGSAMIACIVLGIRAIVRRDFVGHGAWMTRAYAIGIGAGTQAIVLIPGSIIFGSTHEVSRTALMGAGWIINLAVAEVVIRRRAHRRLLHVQASRLTRTKESAWRSR